MADESVIRKLTAIFYADVAGYSRLTGEDEAATHKLLSESLDVMSTTVDAHEGRVVHYAGDAVLAEFGSVVAAVTCAVAVQRDLQARNADLAEDRRVEFRIGINLGEVIVDRDDIYGDGVNVAARLEGLAQPGGICVSGAVFDQIDGKLQVQFRDLGEQAVKNIAKPVRAYGIEFGVTDTRGEDGQPRPVGEVTLRPAVAVLPFANMSGDEEQEYFADGLTEDLITALAAWRSFPVISRNSTFTYKNRAVRVQDVAEELGARYIIEGSVRRGGKRIRITAQLIDAQTGHHVWAERFDREIDDLFELQDEITQRIAAIVEPELGRVEGARTASKPPANLDAWEYFQRGMWSIYKFERESIVQAREMFDQALVLDDTYSHIYAGYGYSHHLDVLFGYTEDREASISRLDYYARKAVQLDRADAFAQLVLAYVYRWTHRLTQALEACERAVTLNPSNSWALGTLGNLLDLSGDPDRGAETLEKAVQISPRDVHSHLLMTIQARAHLNARRYEKAVEVVEKAIVRRSDHARSFLILASSLGHLGRTEEAAKAVAECERLQPGFIEKWTGWREYLKPEDNDHILEGLHKAGWSH